MVSYYTNNKYKKKQKTPNTRPQTTTQAQTLTPCRFNLPVTTHCA